MSISEFLHMGGYASYVWTSYLLTLAVVLINWFVPRHCERSTLRRLQRQARRRVE